MSTDKGVFFTGLINAIGALDYKGTWNANTNTPTLASGVGAKGDYYIVSVAGTTNLDGITDWQIGDWAIFNGTAWQKIDNSDQVLSVFGRTGAVVAAASDYDASQVDNDSSVAGATVKDALDTLAPGATDNINIFYVGKHGNDANDGKTVGKAFLTITAAIAAASSGDVIKVIDAGTYVENVTLTAGYHLDAHNAVITGNLVINDGSVAIVREISASSGIVVAKTSGTATSYFQAEKVTATGAGTIAIGNTGVNSVLFVNVKQVLTAFIGVGSNAANIGHLHLQIGDIYLTANNSIGLIKIGGTGTIVGVVQHILESGTPTGTIGIDLDGGTIDLYCHEIATDTAYDVSGGALNLIINNLSGVETTSGGTVNVLKASDKASILLNNTHRTSNGTDHANVVLNDTHRGSDGKDHSDVVLNNTHRASDGKDHSDVVLNNTHRGSNGTDHANVVLNDTHRGSDGKDHSDVVLNNTHRGSTSNPHTVTKSQVSLGNVTDDAQLKIASNLSDVNNQQTALNNVTNVSGATNEHVLTKDTATGNAVWKAADGGVGRRMLPGFVISGNSSPITIGLKLAPIVIPFDCTLNAVLAYADKSITMSDTILDLWKTDDTDYDAGSTHPVNGDSITASAPLTISTETTKEKDSTLTGWTTSFSKGDLIFINVDQNHASGGAEIITVLLDVTPT